MFDCGRHDSCVRGGRHGVIILGIDPGLANTGWGVVERDGSQLRCLAYGCIRTTGARGRGPAPRAHPRRRARRHRALHPTECAVESVYFGSNAKSAFATGQARGVALAGHRRRAASSLGEYSPVQIKSVVVGSRDRRQGAGHLHGACDARPRPRPAAGSRRRCARRGDHACNCAVVALEAQRARSRAAEAT